PLISMVAAPVSASRSPFGNVTKQPLGQKSTCSPAPSVSSDLLDPSVTTIVRLSGSRLTALAARPGSLAAASRTKVRQSFFMHSFGVATASVTHTRVMVVPTLYERRPERQLNDLDAIFVLTPGQGRVCHWA